MCWLKARRFATWPDAATSFQTLLCPRFVPTLMKRLVVALAMLAFLITLPSTPTFMVPEPRNPEGGKKGGSEFAVLKPSDLYRRVTGDHSLDDAH